MAAEAGCRTVRALTEGQASAGQTLQREEEEGGGYGGSKLVSRSGQYMHMQAYSAPAWAAHLPDIPTETFSLASVPTPIHRWNVPGLPDDVELYVKRDDLSGMALSGNKVRKLEFLLARAKKDGHDCVITIGGIQSNHCRATAVAARYLDMDSYLVLRTNQSHVDLDPGLTGNLLVERLVGANVRLVSKEEYQMHGSMALGEALARELRREGRNPYLIPVGGSSPLGTWGYLQCMAEIEAQLDAGVTDGAGGFDDLVCASGSGATAGGLALGVHLATTATGLRSSLCGTRVRSYGVCDDPDYFYNYIQGLFDGLGIQGGVSSRQVLTMAQAKGLGYALSSKEELEFVAKVASKTGVILDPVYSGKALFGLLNDIKSNPRDWAGKRVLFVHTGGLLGMYDKVNQIQPMVGRWARFNLAELENKASV